MTRFEGVVVAGAGPVGLGVVAALDHQGAPVGAGGDVVGPTLHGFDRERRPLGDMSVGVDDPHGPSLLVSPRASDDARRPSLPVAVADAAFVQLAVRVSR